ncbi:MAG TPA: aminotransferase class I/II-fold pyridoxal phosphate-dependent enzyme [Gemmatimonadaceae bacterium]|nr:aminotransferase class I/II-fold pyridoxal phosphate-dependent enzyme [Gemmatimonadaceae bacterium]
MTATAANAGRLSPMAEGLLQSEILKIAAEVRAMTSAGREVCNLTVGDFDPREFAVPDALRDGVIQALRDGETNYPPSDGLLALREAIAAFYSRRAALAVPIERVLVASGSRPVIYAAYRAVCAPGDRVVYPVPSWNNPHYCHLVGAREVPVPCDPAEDFLPTRARLEDALRGARLLVLNSPCNPTGTMFARDVLAGICDAVLEENARRAGRERPLYLIWDQVYWLLAFGEVPHVSPLALRPELAEYTIVVDGISKALAATGLRVGWSVAPPDVTRAMSDLVGHVGAWAPRAEQVATARVLADDAVLDAHARAMCAGLSARLELLRGGIEAMRTRGLPVECLRPEGAMYLSARVAAQGRRAREGRALESDDEVRRWLLESAGLAAVPFQAFASREETGWFRLSVGAASMDALTRLLPRLESALASLT